MALAGSPRIPDTLLVAISSEFEKKKKWRSLANQLILFTVKTVLIKFTVELNIFNNSLYSISHIQWSRVQK